MIVTTSGPPFRVTEEQIAAAQLRRVLDEKLGRQTPEVVERIAVSSRAVPEAAVGRLAVYLRVLTSMIEQGVSTMSSEELAGAAGVRLATLRKDLSYVGAYGTRGVGYDTARLVERIERLLGLARQHSVAIVGVGNLGHALANYRGFADRGFPVTALFDIDEDLIGIPVGGLPVDRADSIPAVCNEREVTVGVICTPATAAQVVCDLLVAGGVQCILNFAPVVLQVPDDIEVRRVDLAVELQILSFHQARRFSGAEALPAVVHTSSWPPQIMHTTGKASIPPSE
jgi:redox-sensing transcriptional repressor